MNERTNRTVICSIAFLDIVDYSKRVGQEQLAMKERFNTLIGEVVKDIAQNDRVLIDTGDGAALCFMGAPEDALFVSMNLRDLPRTPECEAMGLSVRFGINLGPVRMIHDINGHQNVIGDGINVAQRVMSFAEPNQIMVSRSYYEVVSRLSREYTLLFHYAGARTDKHVREHEVFEVGPGKDEPAPTPIVPPDRVEDTAMQAAAAAAPSPQAASTVGATSPQADGVGGATPPAAPATAAKAATMAATDGANTAPAPARNKWLIPGVIAAVVLLGVTYFAGTQMKSGKVSEVARSETPAAPAAGPVSSPAGVASPPQSKSEGEAKVSALVAGSAPAPRPGAEAVVSAPVDATTPGPKSGIDAKSTPPLAGSVPGTKLGADGKPMPPQAGLTPGTKGGADAKMNPPLAGAVPGTKSGADAKMTSPVAGTKSEADAKAAAAKASGADAAKALAAADKAQKKDVASGAPKSESAAKAEKSGNGTLEFWISPWGDVFIDGARVGTSPPLKTYKLPAGPHRIEVYNDSAGFPYKTTIEVKADQVSRVNQTFRQQ